MMLPEMSWDYVLAYRQNGAVELNDKDGVERTLSDLRETFGDDFMALPAPLAERLLNAAPWTYAWLHWLSNSLRGLEPVDGFAGLRDRLRQHERYDEALSVLQVADRLSEAGLMVGFDVPVAVDGRRKVPDIVVRDCETNVAFHCEVSVLYSAQGQVDQSRAVECLVAPLLFKRGERVAYAGRLLRPIAEDEIEGLYGRIQWEILEVGKEQSFREVNLENTLLLALAPARDADRIAQWARERGFAPDSFGGVSPAAADYGRLRLKVEEEAKQLPAGQANLLVILAQDLFLHAASPLDLLQAASDIIAHYDKIAVLVLASEDFGSVVPHAMKSGDHLVAVNDRDSLVHRNLIVSNPSSVPLPESTRNKIRLAFSC
jgi:hypothetical protein